MRTNPTDAVELPSPMSYELLFQALPLPASLSREQDGCLLAVNQAWLELTGFSREEAIGHNGVELGFWPDSQARSEHFRRLAEGVTHQMRNQRTGRLHKVRLTVKRLEVSPQPLLLIVLQDTTREHEAEQALQQSNLALQQRVELYGAMERLAGVGHWTNAADEESVIWSDGLGALTGLGTRRYVTRQQGRGGIHPDDLPAWMAAREAMDERDVEFRWERPDNGQTLWLRTRMGRTAVAGNPQTDFGVVQDITAEKAAEQALASRFALIRNLTERVPGMVFQTRLPVQGWGIFEYVSEAAQDLLALTPAQLYATPQMLFSRVHADDRIELGRSIAASSSGLMPWKHVFRIVHPAKGLRWCSAEGLPQSQPDGSVLWYGYAHDVTEAREAAHELERQHRMLEAVRLAQSAYIEAQDKRKAFDGLLQALLRVTDSAYGFVAEVLYDPADKPYLRMHAITDIAWNEASRRLMAEHGDSGLEFRNLSTLFGHALVSRECVIANDAIADARSGGLPEGHPPMSAFMGIPLAVGDRLIAMVGLANAPEGYRQEDVEFLEPLLGTVRQLVLAQRGHAERQRSRLQLQATSALLEQKSAALQLTLDSISQGLILVDAQGRVQAYNRRLLSLLDLPEELLSGQPLLADLMRFQDARGDFGENFDLVDPDARAAFVDERIFRDPPSIYLRRTRQGRMLEVFTFVLDGGAMVRTFSDVTHFLEAQQEIRELNANLERRVIERTAELERSMRDMEVISYSIAHDLRAPLRSVNGFASLIEEMDGDRLSPEGRMMFERIASASRNMGQMITDMLELLRVVRVEIEPEPVNMNELARSVVEALAPGVPHARIDLHPLPTVKGDAKLLRQLLSNLMDNALKYSRHRSDPVVELGFDAQRQAFYLRDNGMGFDMAHASKLFGLFQRLHAGTAAPGGTGVGLAIVARTLERHGGKIWAEAQPGAGATFWWVMPMT